jgi:hypothetical protein
VAFLKASSVFRVESSPEVSEAVFSVKSAGFSKVVSSKLSTDDTKVEVSGLREEATFRVSLLLHMFCKLVKGVDK